jgi:formate dehydrogenase alpha subunit
MTALANALGCQWGYESSNDVQAEIMKLLPGYYNLGQPRKVVPVIDRYLSNGYASDVAARYRASASSDAKNGRPFTLLMGQVLYHSGKLSTEAIGLITIAPNTGRLRMNPQDMDHLAVSEGTTVRLTSDRGSMQLAVQSDHSIAPQTCFFPEHFNEPPVKDLMSVHVDPTTGVPTFKQARVTIEKV